MNGALDGKVSGSKVNGMVNEQDTISGKYLRSERTLDRTGTIENKTYDEHTFKEKHILTRSNRDVAYYRDGKVNNERIFPRQF